MKDLLNRPTEADRLRVLGIVAKPKVVIKEHPLSKVERETLATIADLADIAKVSYPTITRLLKKHPELLSHSQGKLKIVHKQPAVDLLQHLGIGKFGDGRYTHDEIAKAYRVSHYAFYAWLDRLDLPERTVFKSYYPAWTSEDAEIVCARFEERLR